MENLQPESIDTGIEAANQGLKEIAEAKVQLASGQEQLDAGKDVILEIEIQGALKVKEKYPDALMLFLVPPDAQTLKERLVGRGTETADVIHDRLERAAQEAQEMGSYEYIIVNDDLDTCVKQVHELIQSAHCKKSHNTAFIKELQQDMNCFLKGE